jgi:bacterioferritin (cytochrome b1)
LKPGKGVVDALDQCLKYERTIQDCHEHYASYFARWRFHRLHDDFREFARDAGKRKRALMLRIHRLDTVPGNDRFDFDGETLSTAQDIDKVMEYFDTMYEDAREAYEQARKTCKDAEDSVSHKLCGKNKEGIEHDLARIEAKTKRIALVGAPIYLGHHFHEER